VQAPTTAPLADAQTTTDGKVCYDIETPKEPGSWTDIKVCEIATNKLPTVDMKLIAIGSSTGGPQVLSRIVPRLPAHLNYAIIIVQHMPPTFTVSFAERLAKRSRLVIKEAQHGDIIKKGHVYVAPGDLHVQVSERNVGGKKVPMIEMNAEPKIHGVRPSVDVLMKSVAKVFGKNSIGVILTGMGKDGAVGMKEIAEVGGRTIVQDRSTSTVYGMPGAVLEMIKVDKVAPVDEIAMQILVFL
jgi:two-component system chemotaxis response regulator CheB